MLISWLYLMIAILFEVSGTICMKLSQEFTKILPSIFIFVFYGLCLTFLTLCLRKLEVSIVYAVWAGLGTVLISIIGIVWFRESFTLMKFVSIVLIIVGVIGLNLSEYGR
ncbi:MAG: DMT family transporter [Sphaerospermopsis kisseleviana]|nr:MULTISPECIES: multidrug efflux SMR transporter [Sphaerospermopsis]MBE9235389.1 multidrug efflux SMR transporter [Sphaerospermopsis aphanizomenoides LEGE 00250]MDB9440716.1 multidrug efflux SMR transporter [Sphaerospermopsis kisseleviana CS-549]